MRKITSIKLKAGVTVYRTFFFVASVGFSYSILAGIFALRYYLKTYMSLNSTIFRAKISTTLKNSPRHAHVLPSGYNFMLSA